MQPMDEVYRKYAQIVYGFLLARTRDKDLAEELTQETFFQAIRSSDRFDESCKVSTWLCGIAKNVLLTYRRKHPANETLEELTASGPEPESVPRAASAGRLPICRAFPATASAAFRWKAARTSCFVRLVPGEGTGCTNLPRCLD